MAKRWSDLSAGQRRLLVVAAVVESALKVAMLVDLRRRDAGEVRGSKRAWAATTLIGSGGIAQLAYFVVGRRR